MMNKGGYYVMNIGGSSNLEVSWERHRNENENRDNCIR